jgi:hypothetical protein
MKLGGRIEYYSDPAGVLIPIDRSVFRTAGLSLNVDYFTAQNMLLRAEGRMFRASDAIFPTITAPSQFNGFLVMSCSVWM